MHDRQAIAAARAACDRTTRLRRVSSSRGTILVIDDEDAVQRLVRFPLEREGYRVLGAIQRRGRTARSWRPSGPISCCSI